jgi:hypothetical protein
MKLILAHKVFIGFKQNKRGDLVIIQQRYLYLYGYLNRMQSSRGLEKETHRNVELMWLLERLQPDLKTIADFRKDNGKGIKIPAVSSLNCVAK